MKQYILAVPNFSEGRRADVIETVAATLKNREGVKLVSCEPEHDFNRTVLTIIGEPGPLKEALIEMAGKSYELIDMTEQEGTHPRIGAQDTIPLFPFSGIDLEEVKKLAEEIGQAIHDKYNVPVLFSGENARTPDKKSISFIRKGQYEGLKALLEDSKKPEREGREPDLSKDGKLDPKMGATIVSADKVIDLSQEIYQGMPVFGMHQKTFIMTNQTHEQNMKVTGSPTLGFSARNLLISEHGPTHTDAIWEFLPGGPTIEQMDFNYFFGDALCIDVSHIRYPDYITIDDIKETMQKANLEFKKGDILLLYTGHYDRTHPTLHSDDDAVDVLNYGGMQSKHSGIDYETIKWLAEQGVVNVCVDAPAIDQTPDDLDFGGHLACGEFNITNTENLCNLDKVAGTRFIYFGVPLKIRAGTGSPVRAFALVENK